MNWHRFFAERAERLDGPAPMPERSLDQKVAILELYRPK